MVNQMQYPINTFNAVFVRFVFQNPSLSRYSHAIFPPLCNSITRQVIVLESCSNPWKIRRVC